MATENKKEESLFPLEKILTTSAEAYIMSQGKHPSDYRLVGVYSPTSVYHSYLPIHGVYSYQPSHHFTDLQLEMFMEKIPANTEMVTDFKENYVLANDHFLLHTAHGTALIPKERGK
ncbi:hypothetical protein HZB02_02815 [Candidatus Woesearchaeota archaeon]|nr:hypothetical protein [Candidatus Woesearchaeota archaeon]